jgi:hypothetical protein
MFPEMLGQKPLIDEADDLHLAAGFGAFQRLEVPQLFDALTMSYATENLVTVRMALSEKHAQIRASGKAATRLR